MAKFCTKCGAALAEGAKFCTSCGTPVAAPQPAAAPVRGPAAEPAATPAEAPAEKKRLLPRKEKQPEPEPAAKTEPVAEPTPVPASEPAPAPALEPAAVPETEAAAAPQTFSFNASSVLGETALGSIGGDLSAAAAEALPGPFKVIGSSIKTFISSVAAVIKEPKKLIPALVLAVIWLVLNILQATGVESEFTDILSFVTFAKGGMSGGIAGAVGGILGKGLFAGAVTMLIGRIGRKGSGEKRSLIERLKGSFGFSSETLFLWLTGAGAAMLIFLFISGGDTRSAFMAGLACTFLSGSAALSNGFVKQILSSFVRKSKTDVSGKVSELIRGGTAGFAAASFIGLSGIRLILSLLGGFLFVGGIVMIILTKAGVVMYRKKVPAK
ncbi:MAG: zinc ribbon domain-containing protein [Lachnospiraceae bacterium]|nr:zinc ribbon domain-containing protein [Lachnospiraceae bacterium]